MGTSESADSQTYSPLHDQDASRSAEPLNSKELGNEVGELLSAPTEELQEAKNMQDRKEESQVQLVKLKSRENKLAMYLEDIDHTHRSKKAPLLHEITMNRLEQQRLIIASSEWMKPQDHPPDVEWLKWVDSLWFSIFCIVVICANGGLIIMEFRDQDPQDFLGYHLADHAFLVWYVVECVLKSCLFGKSFLIGDVSRVWWNWLDLIVVVSGAIEQWIVPFLLLLAGGRSTSSFSPLKILRLLRLFRVFRLLKVIKIFVSYEMTWVEDQPFQMFMISIIAVNAVTMGLELDIEWDGWVVVEELFLVIYCFEIFVRLAHRRLQFFYNESWKWNNLDFIIVASGVVETWVSPMVFLVQSMILGKPVKHESNGGFAAFMKLFRLMRLLRVLRLVRLLRSIPPLFKLVNGIVEAAAGVQYVLLLAFVMLYATAIVFTTLIGKGLLWEGRAPDAAQESFGSVVTSMFMLFKLMNDDQSVVEGIIDSPFVKLLFAIFMVISNWMVLAVLTSVVSDGMVHNTQVHAEDERKEEFASCRARSCRRLKTMFKDIQAKTIGEDVASFTITEQQFQAMLDDESVLSEFIDAAGGNVSKIELHELFILSSDRDVDNRRVIDYLDFIDKLLNQDNGVVEKSILRLESRQRCMERTLEQIHEIVKSSSSLSEVGLQKAQKLGIEQFMSDHALQRLAHDHVASDTLEAGFSPKRSW